MQNTDDELLSQWLQEKGIGDCRCGRKRLRLERTPDLPHYGKAVCGHCGLFIGWVGKPDSDPTKYKRPQEHRKLVKKFSRGFCEMCLRREGELTGGNVLHAHHVIPYSDDGEATRENVWIVCTHCHRIVELQRTYVGHKTLQPPGD